MGFPGGRDAEEFDRRWAELAEQLASEMPAGPPHGSSPAVDDDGPSDPANGAAGAGPLADPAARALDDLQRGVDPWASDAGGEEDAWTGGTASDTDEETRQGSVPGPRDWATREAEEHFTPPEPPPVMSGDPLLVLAWMATGIGLVGLALIVVTHWHVPWYAPRALALLAAAGIATLIWRMPHKREDSEDTGAQV